MPKQQCEASGGTWTPTPGAQNPVMDGACSGLPGGDQGGDQAAGVNWGQMGWTGDAAQSSGLENLLGQFFADPSEQMKYFEEYDPAGEQAATKQMQLGQQQAQQQAQGSMWKQFEAGRQGKGGFGGAGRARQTAMGGIFKGLETGKEQAQLGLQEDIRGMHEQYRGDVMGQIGSLAAADVEGASEEQIACAQSGGVWYPDQNLCGGGA